MSHQLTIEPLGETIEVEEDESLLDACLRAGIWLPYACYHGRCATCKVQVLEGEVEHGDASPFALMDMEREDGMCLACCARPLDDLVIEAEVEEEPDALHLPVGQHTGTVTEITDLTPRIKRILIDVPGEGVAFQAGQYLNLHIPDLDEPRAFSFANPPQDPNRVELNVALVEGGAGTSWLHNALKTGDTLTFTAPLGRFYVRKSLPEPMIFMAGGSGLSSPRSMILDLLASGDTRPITLFHGARNLAELYYLEQFETLATEHANFTYVPVLSGPDIEPEWQGDTGFIPDAAKARFDTFAGHRAYLCGPPAMIDACITTLMQGRLFEEGIFVENFYSNADREAQGSPLFKRL